MNFTLIGDRVLVKLDRAEDHTKTSWGYIPSNKLEQTEGGQVKTKLSDDVHLTQGTVIQIGPGALLKFQELGAEIKEGDKVYINPSAKRSDSYYFYPDRTLQIQDFEGYICVPHVLVEAKVNNEEKIDGLI